MTEVRKVLSKISKEKGFEELADWIKPCVNHLQWSAMTTYDGNGMVIWAKFKAFMSHIINKHTDLEDPLFTGENICTLVLFRSQRVKPIW